MNYKKGPDILDELLSDEHQSYEWMEPWVRELIEMTRDIICSEFASCADALTLNAGEFYQSCTVVLGSKWRKRLSERSETGPEYSQDNFLNFCELYQNEGMFLIEQLLSQQKIAGSNNEG